MDVTGPTGVVANPTYAVRMERIAQDQVRVDGDAAVELIEQAVPPPPGPDGQGTHVNRYA
jgi:hypothetical protein